MLLRFFSYLKEREKTTQSRIHEQEETKRTKIVEEENTKRVKIQSAANSNEIEKIADIFLRNNNSLPPDELRKQNIDNFNYYNEFLKQRNNKAFSKIKYQAETSLPAYNTSIKEEKTNDTKEGVYKLFLQFITSIKDDNDENKI